MAENIPYTHTMNWFRNSDKLYSKNSLIFLSKDLHISYGSPDGLGDQFIIEVKCPFKKTLSLVSQSAFSIQWKFSYAQSKLSEHAYRRWLQLLDSDAISENESF